MKNDEIVDEVRNQGLALAARHGNNLEAICKALKEKEGISGRKIIDRIPRKLPPIARLVETRHDGQKR